jgi:hypothetical protein
MEVLYMNELISMASNGTIFEKGLIVTLLGMLGVFFVLIVFYFLIILLQKVFPYKTANTDFNEENGD